MLDQTLIIRAKHSNLIHLVHGFEQLKRVASTGGGEYAGPCPFCGGKDRFRVQPNHEGGGLWLCRGCTGGKWQDAIAYVMRRDSVNFVVACQRLGAGSGLNLHAYRPKQQMPKPKGTPSLAWQSKARQLREQCEQALWSDEGMKARQWLNARGLGDETLQRWRIGFNPVARFDPLADWGLPEEYNDKGHLKTVWLPRGVVMTCEIAGTPWYCKIRRSAGEPKYVNVKGSCTALFNAEGLMSFEVAALTEGQFDCMLLHQAAGDLVGVATLGSANEPLDVSMWARYLLPVSRFLIAYDVDGKSEGGAASLAALSARMRRIYVPKLCPNDKDITDFWKAGGNLRDWLTFELARLNHACAPTRMESSLQDPRVVHQEILNQIVASVQSHERASGRTWAEILHEVEAVAPELVQKYDESYEAADCDIYGRWKSGAMTQGDLDRFKIALNAWQQATLELLKYHSEKCAS